MLDRTAHTVLELFKVKISCRMGLVLDVGLLIPSSRDYINYKAGLQILDFAV